MSLLSAEGVILIQIMSIEIIERLIGDSFDFIAENRRKIVLLIRARSRLDTCPEFLRVSVATLTIEAFNDCCEGIRSIRKVVSVMTGSVRPDLSS